MRHQSKPDRKTMEPIQYHYGLYWILRERAGGGGWPPRDINAVSGWLVVRMLAHLSGRTPREVAADVVEHAKVMGEV
jgi:hypothetical protein